MARRPEFLDRLAVQFRCQAALLEADGSPVVGEWMRQEADVISRVAARLRFKELPDLPPDGRYQ